MNDTPSALGFLRVLDVAESIAGQFCGRLLADHGAEVILIEPPGGSALRRTGPFSEARPGDSLLFFHLNTGKQSLTLDRASEDGRRLLRELAARADVLIVPAGFDRAPFGDLAHCILATVSPFGDDGPRRHWKGSEMVYQAISGSMTMNGSGEREPLYGTGKRASYSAGIATFNAVLAALMARERFGTVQDVAVDIAHNAASMTYPFALQHSYNGSFERRGARGTPLIELKCRDGWMSIWVRPPQFEAVCECLDAPELIADARFRTGPERQQHFGALVDELQARVADRLATELVAKLQSRRVVAACCFRPTQLGPQAPHLQARGHWRTVDTPDGPRDALGPALRMSRTPARPVRALRPFDDGGAR